MVITVLLPSNQQSSQRHDAPMGQSSDGNEVRRSDFRAAMENGESSVLIPEQPDRAIQANIETATCGTLPWCKNATCQVALFVGSRSNWVLQSRDQEGNLKFSGGDEYYVRYQEFTSTNQPSHDETSPEALTCQAVALIQDHDNGKYTLEFVATPMYPTVPAVDPMAGTTIKRVLTIYFEYTNGIGALPPPIKCGWPNGGYTHRSYSLILCSDLDYRPPIRPFVPPSCSVDLGLFDRVFAFGDSTMDQFVRQRPNKKGKYYFQPNILVGEKVRQGLNSDTLGAMLDLLEQEFGGLLRRYEKEGKRVCLILGSGLWDILDANDKLQGASFEDHIRACREYISQVKRRYHATVVWKSPMAVHIHWVDLDRVIEHDKATATLFGRDRIRYMSSSRSMYLYNCQRRLMEALGVPLLDIFEASYLSADQLYPSDGRHYRPDLNRLMLSWFSPSFSRDQQYYQNLE